MIFNSFSQKLSLFLLLSAFLLLIACDKDQHNHPNLLTGKDFFNSHCAGCHNNDGTGLFLKGAPANISTNKNISELIRYIKEGDQHGHSKMPVFKTMSDKEANKIAHYLLVLKSDYFNNPENNHSFLLKRRNQKKQTAHQ